MTEPPIPKPAPVPRGTGPAAPREAETIVRPIDHGLPTVGSSELWGRKIRVDKELELGGMSYIVQGTDVRLGRELALKVTPLPKKQMPRGQVARFLEEAQITAQLEHPNVVPVHELGVDPEGRVFFSMKLVRGQSLEAILEKRRQGDARTLAEFGLRRLLDVFLQVCQAIEYAHARGVVHRDLKPANIMVGDFGEVLVMDWGVAKLLGHADRANSAVTTVEVSDVGDEISETSSGDRNRPGSRTSDITSLRSGKQVYATQAGALIGTPAYMSPEQAKGLSVDERSDLYALGTMLYEILCDRLPFEEEDAKKLLEKTLREPPPRPSSFNPAAPLALEKLALRLLEKDPERRSLPISKIRADIQDYFEGIGRDFHGGSLATSVAWIAGAVALFAFLVWYVTGQSIRALFAIAPATVFTMVGWFLLVLALGSPLRSAFLALRPRADRDPFGAPTSEEHFVSGYLAHRTLATAVAPIFQLIFIAELLSLAVTRTHREKLGSAEYVERLTAELRAEWAQSLIVILIFLFAYLFFLSSEVRFARRIDRYDALVQRPAWEAVWPFFLIFLLLFTIGTTHVLDWALSGRGDFRRFMTEHVLTQPLDLIEIGKTLVFQGTFLAMLVAVTLLVAFPLAEVLAAVRLPYQPADEASVRHRTQYFARSVAIFRVARVSWLYGGAMIGSLTAMSVLSRPVAQPLVKQVLYILAPSLVGFIGYGLTRRHLKKFLKHAPAVDRLLDRQVKRSRLDLARIVVSRLQATNWRERILELSVPFVCIAIYLLWIGSGIHERAIQQLLMPVTAEGWLLILPYVLLIPVLLLRDWIQAALLGRRLGKNAAKAPDGSIPPPPPA